MEFDFRRTQKQIASPTEPIIPVEEVGHLSYSYTTLKKHHIFERIEYKKRLIGNTRRAVIQVFMLQNSLLY
jgi:hypothetical protein